MATIKDVAERAGVSTATVSYVINKSRYVSDERTERVLHAIKELEFAPSRRARGLRKGSTSAIGVIIDDITNRFASQFIRGLERSASEANYTTILSDLQRDPANEARSLSMLVEEEVDGIVYDGYGKAEDQLIELFRGGLPVVVVDKPPKSTKLPSVLIDNRDSMYKCLEHLTGLGHREVLFITGLEFNRNTELRVKAFREFMTDRNFPCPDDCVFFGDYTLEHGYETTLKIVAQGRSFSALVCGDDLIAFAAIAALKSKSVRIPDDVAVVGFDDDPMSSLFDPSLTTIRYPMQEMGSEAFGLLSRYLSGRRKSPKQVILDTDLVVRRSTDAVYSDYHTRNN